MRTPNTNSEVIEEEIKKFLAAHEGKASVHKIRKEMYLTDDHGRRLLWMRKPHRTKIESVVEQLIADGIVRKKGSYVELVTKPTRQESHKTI